MVDIRRPVFVSGENPGMTLFVPGTDRAAAAASYWNCTLSPWGVGRALILWLEPGSAGQGGIFSDNPAMAQGLVNSLVQYFPEFKGIPLTQLACMEAACQHTFDGDKYRAFCQTANTRIEIAWSKILDQKQVVWAQFPAGPLAYDLTTVICPCGEAQIWLNGVQVGGEVQTAQTAEGKTGSSAFLGLAETWIGPLAPEEAD